MQEAPSRSVIESISEPGGPGGPDGPEGPCGPAGPCAPEGPGAPVSPFGPTVEAGPGARRAWSAPSHLPARARSRRRPSLRPGSGRHSRRPAGSRPPSGTQRSARSRRSLHLQPRSKPRGRSPRRGHFLHAWMHASSLRRCRPCGARPAARRPDGRNSGNTRPHLHGSAEVWIARRELVTPERRTAAGGPPVQQE